MTYEKSPSGDHVTRADGTVLARLAFEQAEYARGRSLWGSVQPDLLAALADSPTEDTWAVMVAFTPGATSPKVPNAADGSSVDAPPPGVLEDAVAGAWAKVAAQLKDLGIQGFDAGIDMPVAFGQMKRSEIEHLAKVDLPGVLVWATPPAQPVMHADNPGVSSPTSGIQFSNLDLLNNQGYYGQGQKVGIVFEPCNTREDHPALAQNTIYYQAHAPSICGGGLDCLGRCGDVCVAGVCVSVHDSQVQSVMSDGWNKGISAANFYLANALPTAAPAAGYPLGNACNPAGMRAAMSWFGTNAVPVINESFGCRIEAPSPVGFTIDGFVEDYYARVRDMLVVRSAGNGADDPTMYQTERSKQACPTVSNGICAGATDHRRRLATYSNFVNPGYPPPGSSTMARSDREEPDLLEFGGVNLNDIPDQYTAGPSSVVGATRVIDPYTDSLWTGNSGTSFSAPLVAAEAVLLRQKCAAFGKARDHLTMRVLLGLTANNRLGTEYSTPGSGVDAKDGAGMVNLLSAADWCSSSSGTADINSFTVNTTTGSPPPTGRVVLSKPLPGDTVTDRLSFSRFIGNRADGARIRAMVSWDACSGLNDDGRTTGSLPRTDIDLFLYNTTAQTYLAISQSYDDSNEGFETVVPAGFGGPMYLVVTYPRNALNCGGGTMTPIALGSWVH